jgi:uncharacterized protein YndB with AHSA1/START domain
MEPAAKEKSMLPIAAAAVVLLAILLVCAAAKPDTFRVQRAISIDAPPANVFGMINDFHHWGAWSPYENLDPTMKRTFSDWARGKGAVYAWESDGKPGVGRMEIIESSSPARVAIQLDFARPLAARHFAEFTLSTAGNFTNVTWTMSGRSSFLAKVISVLFRFERTIGRDFEIGLANMKAIAERPRVIHDTIQEQAPQTDAGLGLRRATAIRSAARANVVQRRRRPARGRWVALRA